MTGKTILSVEGLSTTFMTRRGPARAVSEVSFRVDAGESLGIVGESGSGKSVTARSIIGLARGRNVVSSGKVQFGQDDLMQLSTRELRKIRGSRIGFVPQNPFGALNPTLSVGSHFRNLIVAHSGKRPRASVWHDHAIEALEAMGLHEPDRVIDLHPAQLSGGMAQRVVLALATFLQPELVIADEATTALDVTVQRQILDLMRGQVLSESNAMVLVSHDLGVIAQYCDSVAVMYAGKVVEHGPVSKVFRHPFHPYTAALLNATPKRGEPLQVLRGTVPDLGMLPAGCSFRERCGFAQEQCAVEKPILTGGVVGGRAVACFNPLVGTE